MTFKSKLAAILLSLIGTLCGMVPSASAQDGVGGIEYVAVPAILVLPSGQAQRVILLVPVRAAKAVTPTLTIKMRAVPERGLPACDDPTLPENSGPMSAVQPAEGSEEM